MIRPFKCVIPVTARSGERAVAVRRRPTDAERLGRIIRRRRMERDLTLAQLGKAVGRTPSAISAYELGKKDPPLSVLKGIADALEYPLFAFIWELYPLANAAQGVNDAAIWDIAQVDPQLAQDIRRMILRAQKILKEFRRQRDEEMES